MIKKSCVLFYLFVAVYVIMNVSNCTAQSLNWAPANATTVDGYYIYYSENIDNFETRSNLDKIPVTNVENTTYSLDSLPLDDGKTYYFAVTAYNSNGESGFSTIRSYLKGVDSTPPVPPERLTVE